MPQLDSDLPQRHQMQHDRPNAGRAKSGPAFLFDLDGTWWIVCTSTSWPGGRLSRWLASNWRCGVSTDAWG